LEERAGSVYRNLLGGKVLWACKYIPAFWRKLLPPSSVFYSQETSIDVYIYILVETVNEHRLRYSVVFKIKRVLSSASSVSHISFNRKAATQNTA
jgi:hypothetical protein